MDLSIVIPNYNTKTLLDRCLTSLINSFEGSPVSYEIIVVDNASTDGSRELLKSKYTRVIKIFNNGNVGYGKANNQAIKKAKGTYVLLLNSDTKVLEHAVVKLYEFVGSKSMAFAGGKLLNEDGSPQSSCGPFFSIPVVIGALFLKGDSMGFTRYSPTKIRIVDWASGACLMGKKEAFADVGFFDEHIFMYMEEIDFLYRAKQKGYTTYFYPDARFIHTGAASSGERKRPVLNIYRGLVYFYKKHRSIIEQQMLFALLRVKAAIGVLLGKILGNNYLLSTYEEAIRLVH